MTVAPQAGWPKNISRLVIFLTLVGVVVLRSAFSCSSGQQRCLARRLKKRDGAAKSDSKGGSKKSAAGKAGSSRHSAGGIDQSEDARGLVGA